MKGTILFCSKEDVFNENLWNYQIKLQITRYINQGLLTGFTHVPQLSPTKILLNKTMYKWKKLIFTEEEMLQLKNGKTGTWWDLYVVEFEKEMNERVEFQASYNRLKEHLDSGLNIICCCYCDDYLKCHRSLIAKKLQNDGYKVILR